MKALVAVCVLPSSSPSSSSSSSSRVSCSSAASYLSQHGQVEEPGPKLDLNHSSYSMAQIESEYDQAEVGTSLSLPPER